MLSTAGLASLYRLGDPLCARLTGVAVNQPDLPWWAVGILNWIGMVQAMQQASGKLGNTYREMVKQAVETGAPQPFVNVRTGKQTMLSGPASIYGLYQQFSNAVELEANK